MEKKLKSLKQEALLASFLHQFGSDPAEVLHHCQRADDFPTWTLLQCNLASIASSIFRVALGVFLPAFMSENSGNYALTKHDDDNDNDF